MKKLIIWDFDGVIADSERLCVGIWVDMLLKYKGVELSSDEVLEYLFGLSQKTKIDRLMARFEGISFDEEFENELAERKNDIFAKEMVVCDGVEEIVSDKHFLHCIATGGMLVTTAYKLKCIGFEKYFDEKNCFSAEMVVEGKPEPDLFLLAAEKMGAEPFECVVVEDGLAGLKAAKAAGMAAIAYVGAIRGGKEAYKKRCEEMGAVRVCDKMSEVYEAILGME